MKINAAYNLIMMVDELHKMGYEKLRISPGMSATGLCWRCTIAPKHYMECDTGALLNSTKLKNLPHFSVGELRDDSDPKVLAGLFVDEFPETCRMSEGHDADYMTWFDMVVKLAEKANAFPICYFEWGQVGLGMIPMTDNSFAIPFASFGESSDSAEKPSGRYSKFVFTNDQYKYVVNHFVMQIEYAKKNLLRKPVLNENDFVFFWKHYSKSGLVTKSCLSQWFPSRFKMNGITYNCAEQFMMAEKARVFGDEETRKMILSSSDPQEIKVLGRRVKGFDVKCWDSVSYDKVVYGNMAKFSQNRELLEYLVETGDKVLVEASPLDTIWGVGLDESNPDIMNVSKWKGLNKLGFALMEVRKWMVKYKNTLDVIGC